MTEKNSKQNQGKRVSVRDSRGLLFVVDSTKTRYSASVFLCDVFCKHHLKIEKFLKLLSILVYQYIRIKIGTQCVQVATVAVS